MNLKSVFINPYIIFVVFAQKFDFKILPDKIWISLYYRGITRKKMNWNNPKTFNEKLKWLKINDRKPIYSQMVDKYEVRKLIAEKLGKEHLFPCYGVWDRFDDIDFDKLPKEFVLKCTHDSHSVIICKDKNKIDLKKIKTKLEKALKRNFYFEGRQWPYKNVHPRIIAEKLMTDESGSDLKDYKVFCFNGEPKVIQVDSERMSNHHRNFYDVNWNYINMYIDVPNTTSSSVPKPSSLDSMLKNAKILSEGMKFLRVDFYSINGKAYFGELTFYHSGGFGRFSEEKYNELWGTWIDLDK